MCTQCIGRRRAPNVQVCVQVCEQVCVQVCVQVSVQVSVQVAGTQAASEALHIDSSSAAVPVLQGLTTAAGISTPLSATNAVLPPVSS